MGDDPIPSLVNGASSRKEILATSAPWLAALLNVLPGLGAGYIYQRRWRAYWITALLGGFLIGADALPNLQGLPALQGGQLPLPSLLGLAGLTAAEAFLAGRRARMD
jgi:hypothetical protein